ncbi:restriction endonuclease subunit S [Alteribacillus sp. JSM 102045]|uniref:restriction endonuclease subunit S n=1 Tax=Alteribacillus sp. JSM 102045 TaxID=1562101 RepID=UPI0035C1168C
MNFREKSLEDWELLKVSWLFEEISSGTTPKSTNNEYYNRAEVAWINTGDLNDGYLYVTNKKISKQAIIDYPTLKVYPANSLVIALYGATIGRLSITRIPAATNQACCVMTHPKGVSNKFLFYWFLSNREKIIELSAGGGQKNISQSIIKSLRVLLPNKELQEQIVQFLDRKTSEIDTLIADKEKLIKLLEEKRQAIITEAVTKGLDPDLKMKDSGVEWIGEIPKKWDVSTLNLHFIESKTKNEGKKEQNVLSLSYGKIKRRDVESNFGLLPASFETYRIVNSGDIVLRLTDLQNDKRSLRVGLVQERGIITSAYLTLIPRNTITSEYASLLLHSYDLLKVFYGFGSGVRQSIGYPDLKKLPILLPSIEEQKKISQYLNNYLKNMDKTLEELKVQIEKLKEYRQSLIYEAVTGKIDVPDYEDTEEDMEVRL